MACGLVSLHFYAKYARIFEKQTPDAPIMVISIRFMLATPFPSRSTGGFIVFFFSKACSDYHGQLCSRSDGRIFKTFEIIIDTCILLTGGGGGGYSSESWVSTVKLIENVVAVNLHTEGAVTFPQRFI